MRSPYHPASQVASMWNMGMFEDYKGDQTPWARSAITVFAGLVALTIIQARGCFKL